MIGCENVGVEVPWETGRVVLGEIPTLVCGPTFAGEEIINARPLERTAVNSERRSGNRRSEIKEIRMASKDTEIGGNIDEGGADATADAGSPGSPGGVLDWAASPISDHSELERMCQEREQVLADELEDEQERRTEERIHGGLEAITNIVGKSKLRIDLVREQCLGQGVTSDEFDTCVEIGQYDKILSVKGDLIWAVSVPKQGANRARRNEGSKKQDVWKTIDQADSDEAFELPPLPRPLSLDHPHQEQQRRRDAVPEPGARHQQHERHQHQPQKQGSLPLPFCPQGLPDERTVPRPPSHTSESSLSPSAGSTPSGQTMDGHQITGITPLLPTLRMESCSNTVKSVMPGGTDGECGNPGEREKTGKCGNAGRVGPRA